jgi:hypothetical protein
MGDTADTPSRAADSPAGALGKVVDRLHEPALLFGIGCGLVLVLLAAAGVTSWALTVPLMVVDLAALAAFTFTAGRKGAPPSVSNTLSTADASRRRGSAQTIRSTRPASGTIENVAVQGRDSVVEDSPQIINLGGADAEPDDA